MEEWLKKMWHKEVPGFQVVNASPSNARSAGLILPQGAMIPHAMQPKHQTIKQQQYCYKFNKDQKKNGLHRKNLTKKNFKKKERKGAMDNKEVLFNGKKERNPAPGMVEDLEGIMLNETSDRNLERW